MEFKRRLMRLAIESCLERSIPRLKQDKNRGVRSLVDLGTQFASGDRQKAFFMKLQKIVRNPKNPYSALLLRAVNEVDAGIMQRTGVNLGYTALCYGSGLLQTHSELWKIPLPWVLRLDCLGCTADELAALLREGKSYGIFSYVFSVESETQLSNMLKLAQTFPECLFWAIVPAALADRSACQSIRERKNIVVAAKLEHTDDNYPFFRLKAHRLLFGFVCSEQDAFRRAELLSRTARSGCLFGVYSGSASLAKAGPPTRRFFFVNEKPPLPLALIDWQRDTLILGGQIVPGSGCFTVLEKIARQAQFHLEPILRGAI